MSIANDGLFSSFFDQLQGKSRVTDGGDDDLQTTTSQTSTTPQSTTTIPPNNLNDHTPPSVPNKPQPPRDQQNGRLSFDLVARDTTVQPHRDNTDAQTHPTPASLRPADQNDRIRARFHDRVAFARALAKEKRLVHKSRIRRLNLERERASSRVSNVTAFVTLDDVAFQRKLAFQSKTVAKRLQELIFECVGEMEKVCLRSSLQQQSGDGDFQSRLELLGKQGVWHQFLERIREDSLNAIQHRALCPVKDELLFHRVLTKPLLQEVSRHLFQTRRVSVTFAGTESPSLAASPTGGRDCGDLNTNVHVRGSTQRAGTDVGSHPGSKDGVNESPGQSRRGSERTHKVEETALDKILGDGGVAESSSCCTDFNPEWASGYADSGKISLLHVAFMTCGMDGDDPVAVRGADGSVCRAKGKRSRGEGAKGDNATAPQPLSELSAQATLVGDSQDASLATALNRLYKDAGVFASNSYHQTKRQLDKLQQKRAGGGTTRGSPASVANSAPPQRQISNPKYNPDFSYYFRRAPVHTARFPLFDSVHLVSSRPLDWMVSAGQWNNVSDRASVANSRVYYCVEERAERSMQHTTWYQTQQAELASLFASPGTPSDPSRAHVAHRVSQYVEQTSLRVSDESKRNNGNVGDAHVVVDTLRAHRDEVTLAHEFASVCTACSNANDQDDSSSRCSCAALRSLTQLPDILVGSCANGAPPVHFAPAMVHNLLETERYSYANVSLLSSADREVLKGHYGGLHHRNAITSLYVSLSSDEGVKLVRIPEAGMDELLQLYVIRSSVPSKRSANHRDQTSSKSTSANRRQAFAATQQRSSIDESADISLDGFKVENRYQGLCHGSLEFGERMLQELGKAGACNDDGQTGFALVPVDRLEAIGVASVRGQSAKAKLEKLKRATHVFVVYNYHKRVSAMMLEQHDKPASRSSKRSALKAKTKLPVLCTWRSCIAASTGSKTVVLKEGQSGQTYPLCRYHALLVDRLSVMKDGVQEIKRHLNTKTTKASSGGLKKALASMNKANVEKDLILSSSLVTELLNRKLISTVRGFCSKAASASRPHQMVSANKRVNTVENGPQLLQKLKNDITEKQHQLDLLQKVVRVERAVMSELCEYERLDVFPREELASIRNEYDRLNNERSLLFGNDVADHKKKAEREKAGLRFLIHQYDTIMQRSSPRGSGPVSTNSTNTGSRSSEASESLSVADLELEFSLRKLVIFSKNRKRHQQSTRESKREEGAEIEIPSSPIKPIGGGVRRNGAQRRSRS